MQNKELIKVKNVLMWLLRIKRLFSIKYKVCLFRDIILNFMKRIIENTKVNFINE